MLYETKYEKFIPSKLVVKHYFLKFMGKKLDLKNPKTFNEKLNWLKLHNRNANQKASLRFLNGVIYPIRYT